MVTPPTGDSPSCNTGRALPVHSSILVSFFASLGERPQKNPFLQIALRSRLRSSSSRRRRGRCSSDRGFHCSAATLLLLLPFRDQFVLPFVQIPVSLFLPHGSAPLSLSPLIYLYARSSVSELSAVEVRAEPRRAAQDVPYQQLWCCLSNLKRRRERMHATQSPPAPLPHPHLPQPSHHQQQQQQQQQEQAAQEHNEEQQEEEEEEEEHNNSGSSLQQQQQVPQAEDSVQNHKGDAAAAVGAGSPSSAGEARKSQDIQLVQLVQNLIERCLQLYMNQAEVINTLLRQAKIEPGFTSLVWQKLEEQNPDFFKAYYTRLKLKKHIVSFNLLLEQQYQLMQRMRLIPTRPMQQQQQQQPPHAHSNGGIHHPLGSVPVGYPVSDMMAAPPTSATAAHAHMSPLPSPGGAVAAAAAVAPPTSPGDGLPDSFQDSPSNSGMDLLQCPAGGDMSTSANGVAGFSFGIGNPVDMLPSLDASFAAPPHDQPQQPMSGDEDVNSSRESLGALGHIPRNFSLSDLAAELGHSDLEVLDNYSSPFLSSDAEAFLQSPDDDIIGDNKLLDLDFGDLKSCS